MKVRAAQEAPASRKNAELRSILGKKKTKRQASKDTEHDSNKDIKQPPKKGPHTNRKREMK